MQTLCTVQENCETDVAHEGGRNEPERLSPGAVLCGVACGCPAAGPVVALVGAASTAGQGSGLGAGLSSPTSVGVRAHLISNSNFCLKIFENFK